MLAHAQGTPGFPTWIPSALTNHGKLGVHIFFVISGFLITTLLMEEQSKTGVISLGLFYARRTLRIFPPLYGFLAVIAIAAWLGALKVPAANFLAAVTFTMNYFPMEVWVTNHLWSLSVEEQFYLVWPLTLKLAGIRQALWMAAMVAAAAPLTCLGVYLVNTNAGASLSMYMPFVADAIAAGCVLAGIRPWLRVQPGFRWFASPAGGLVIPVILLLDLGRNHPRIHFGITETVLNLCICYAIVRYTEFPRGFAGKLLNLPGISYVGRLSYSLYLWQQIFMNPDDPRHLFPINVAESFGCALLSYYLIELPASKFRQKFKHTASLSSPEKRLGETA